MKSTAIDLYRREFIVKTLAGSALGFIIWPGFVRTACGMGVFSYPQGMQKMQGDVKVNGIPVQVGAPVKFGDVVTTGPESYAVFVIDKSVYLIRDNTRVELSGNTSDKYKEKIVDILRLINGKMLSADKWAEYEKNAIPTEDDIKAVDNICLEDGWIATK